MSSVGKLRLTVAATAMCTFGFAAVPAQAATIVLNTWYAAQFGFAIPSAVSGPGVNAGANGPVLGGGFASGVLAPAGTDWSITLTSPGTLTVTDVEVSGDRFTVFDNGTPMSAAASPFTAAGQNPGQVSPGSGLTSVPVPNAASVGENINEALGNADFSSATFALLAGLNDITIQYDGVIGGGDMDFIAETSATPLPATLPLFATGLGALGLLGWRRKRKSRISLLGAA